ncbi:hypothetical protein I5860_007915 [Clostridioides difficile]
MNYKLILAIVFITSALIFYTIGVFGERKAKILKKKHVKRRTKNAKAFHDKCENT